MSINSSAICSCSFVLIKISSEWQNSENKSFLCNICSQLIFLRFAWFRCQSCAVHFQDGFRNNDYFGAIYTLNQEIRDKYMLFGWLFNQMRKCHLSLGLLCVYTSEGGVMLTIWKYTWQLLIHWPSNTLTIWKYTWQPLKYWSLMEWATCVLHFEDGNAVL